MRINSEQSLVLRFGLGGKLLWGGRWKKPAYITMFWPIGPFHSTKTCYKHSKNTTGRIPCHFSHSAYTLDYFVIFFGFVVVDWKCRVVFLCMGGLHQLWWALPSVTQTYSKGVLLRDPHLSVYVHMHFFCILIWWGADALIHNSRNRDGQGAKRPT